MNRKEAQSKWKITVLMMTLKLEKANIMMTRIVMGIERTHKNLKEDLNKNQDHMIRDRVQAQKTIMAPIIWLVNMKAQVAVLNNIKLISKCRNKSLMINNST